MHTIDYINTDCTWDEALFLGNGFFGAMMYNQENSLTCIMNHYDIFYSRQYLIEKTENSPGKNSKGGRYQEITDRALLEHNKEGSKDHRAYPYTLFPEFKENYGWDRTGRSYPVMCELKYEFSEKIYPFMHTKASMDLSKGSYCFLADNDEKKISIKKTVIRDTAVSITDIESSHNDSIRSLELLLPCVSGLDRKMQMISYSDDQIIIDCTHWLNSKQRDDDNSFRFCILIKLNGIGFDDIISMENGFKLINVRSEQKASIIISAATGLEGEDALTNVRLKSDIVSKDPVSAVSKTEKYWNDFFKRSWIDIPDKFIEKLWYINLYSLDCSSGNGAVIGKNACGLSGLWSIKQPSQWGSLWYWDVNIEQAFWPVYTSNHLYTGEAFINGLLCYVDKAKQRAKDVFGLEGIAADYPFEFFMCLWPWCAQFFWWHYKYSQDKDFLQEKAYPLFKDILLFFTDYLKYDADKAEYYVFPDISPEQGPVTRNSTITLSCLKFLLEFTIKAAEILDCDKESRKIWNNILDRFPPFPTAVTNFGKIIKDSEWADDDLYLAHASLLMPIYPVGHISKRSDSELVDIALNTMEYVDKRINIVTHAFGWEACALVRLGFASDGLRALYDKGIAYSLRTNGLFAEETNRWIQNCLTACAPVYNPPLLEAGSSTAAAVNEMLLSSFDDTIEVFPSVPDGNYRLKKKSDRRFEEIERKSCGYPETWSDLSFNGLLAQGAFLVSAVMKNRKTVHVRIKSLAGTRCRIIDPFDPSTDFGIYTNDNEIMFLKEENIVSFDTQKGEEYILRLKTQVDHVFISSSGSGIQKYVSLSNRRIFIGKDEHTDYLSLLDNATFDYYQGDIRTSRIAVYRFDFGHTKEELSKNYETVLPKQYHACGKLGLDFKRITKNTLYNDDSGYGWIDTANLLSADRKHPDELRRDFIQSSREAEFKIQLAKGTYQIFFGFGDHDEECSFEISINGYLKTGPFDLNKAGYKMVSLPFDHFNDGPAFIRFSSKKDSSWKINLMIVNRLL